MNKKIELSIIIVSYNDVNVIRDCLQSVREQNDLGSSLEVIVVEQSPDQAVWRTLAEEFPEFDIFPHENNGFGAGNNAGAARARGRFLLFLNPDTILTEPVGRFAAAKFDEDPSLGLFGVRLTGQEDGPCRSFNMMVPYGFRNRLKSRWSAKRLAFREEEMYIEGADLFVRADVFEKIGGFDEAVFMYAEETDLCTRVRCAGFHVGFFPEVRIVHLQGATTDNRLAERTIRQMKSAFYVYQKNEIAYRGALRSEMRLLKVRAALAGDTGRKKAYAQICAFIESRLG